MTDAVLSAPPQNIRTPYGACGDDMEIHDRLTFSGWTVHPRCSLNTAEGTVDAGEDRFEIAATGEAGLPRRAAVVWHTFYRGSTCGLTMLQMGAAANSSAERGFAKTSCRKQVTRGLNEMEDGDYEADR